MITGLLRARRRTPRAIALGALGIRAARGSSLTWRPAGCATSAGCIGGTRCVSGPRRISLRRTRRCGLYRAPLCVLCVWIRNASAAGVGSIFDAWRRRRRRGLSDRRRGWLARVQHGDHDHILFICLICRRLRLLSGSNISLRRSNPEGGRELSNALLDGAHRIA